GLGRRPLGQERQEVLHREAPALHGGDEAVDRRRVGALHHVGPHGFVGLDLQAGRQREPRLRGRDPARAGGGEPTFDQAPAERRDLVRVGAQARREVGYRARVGGRHQLSQHEVRAGGEPGGIHR
ncbi:unnamed protein product, partial [Phaeothamnion confervicola]